MRPSGLRTGEGEMRSALSALQGKEAKDPSQGTEAKGKESLCGKRGPLKKGGGSMKQYDKTEE